MNLVLLHHKNMSGQINFSYQDGDIVWVKLRSYWWPGQVVGSDKLPDDIQNEFKKKPLLAAVKFFHEDSYEFVKNHQQIYKYNCAQKEDFIKRGLDKFRTKNKDRSNFMKKFPEDVKMAETLTNGNPNIILDNRFSPDKKPDVSGLFGEKKMLKKKRARDDLDKKNNFKIKVTHPRFIKKNDHEIRIRQQPKISPLIYNSSLHEIYPCHVCDFTSTRVNVIIYHLKNHRSNKETATVGYRYYYDAKLKKVATHCTTKKYVKRSTSRKKNENIDVEIKKQNILPCTDDSAKTEKSDPELREKLLADWNVDSDEDESINSKKPLLDSLTASRYSLSSENRIIDFALHNDDFERNKSDNSKLLRESNELLQETNNFIQLATSIHGSNKVCNLQPLEECENSEALILEKNDSFFVNRPKKEQSRTEIDGDKKSRLSCFDFDEEDISESSILSVRKLSRGLGCKNISIKKEIIKEFEMNQALKRTFDDPKLCNTTPKKKKHTEDDKLSFISTNGLKNSKDDDMNENIDIINTEMIEPCLDQKLGNFEIDHKNEKLTKNNEENFNFSQKSFELDNSDLKKDENLDDISTHISAHELTVNEIVDNIKSIACKKNIGDNVFRQKNKKLVSPKKLTVASESDTLIIEDQKSDIYLHQNEAIKTSTIRQECNINQSLSNNVIKSENNEKITLTDCKIEKQNHLIFNKKTEHKSNVNSEITIVDTEHNFSNDKISFCLNELQQKSEVEDDIIPIFTPDTKSGLRMQSETTSLGICDDHKKFEIKSSELKIDETNQMPRKNFAVNYLNNESSSEIKNATYPLLHTKRNVSLSNFESNSCTKNLDVTLFNDGYHGNIEVNRVLIDDVPTDVKALPNIIANDEPCVLGDNMNLNEKKTVIELNRALDNSSMQIKLDTNFKDKNEKCIEIIRYTVYESANPQLSSPNKAYVTKNPMKKECECEEMLLQNTEKTDLVLTEDKEEKEESKQICTAGFTEPVLKDKNSDVRSDICDNDFKKTIDILEHCLPDKEKDSKCSREVIPLDNSNYEQYSCNLLGVNETSNLESMKNEVETSHNVTINTVKDTITPQILTKDKSLEVRDVSEKIDKMTSDLNVKLVKKDELVKLAGTDGVLIPVKKREKPRIIENVTLKEPMILKAKFGGKRGTKINKHKPKNVHIKLNDSKCFMTTKFIKEAETCKNVKTVNNDTHSSLLRECDVINLSSGMPILNQNRKEDQSFTNFSQTESNVLSPKKCVKHSESITNIEFDINSMPFVFSEDVLSAESIEQMPVLISSDLPKVNQINTSLSQTLKTSDENKVVTSETFETFRQVNSLNVMKKKVVTPTVLKNKIKAKPMITSIKTIVPPVKSKIPKGNYQTSLQPLISSDEKKSPGKYVIVQTSGQHTYSTHQSVTIPDNENSANAQIVQQGSKVVIITSPQHDQFQTHLPSNSVSKSSSTGKTQKVMKKHESRKMHNLNCHSLNKSLTPKNNQIKNTPHVYELANKKNFTEEQGSLKNDSSTASKQRSSLILNSTQTLSSKKSSSVSANSSILKDEETTAKNICSYDTLSQSHIRPKNIPTSISPTVVDQILTNPQSIISKGTVLTPITGSQVKAIAAKQSKGNMYDCKKSQNIVLNAGKHKKLITTNFCKVTQNTYDMNVPKKILLRQTNDVMNKTNIKEYTEELINQQPLPYKIETHREVQKGDSVTEKVADNSKKKEFLYLSKTVKVNTLNPSSKLCESLNSSKTLLKNIQKKGLKKQTEVLNYLDNTSNRSSITPSSLNVSSPTAIAHLSEKKGVSKGSSKKLSPVNPTVSLHPDIASSEEEKYRDLQISNETQFMVLPAECNEEAQTYVFVAVNEQGDLISLDDSSAITLNENLPSEHSKTVYIDSNTLCGSKNLDNIVLHIDNSSFSAVGQRGEKTLISELRTTIETSPSKEVSHTSNQDILAVALADTDFNQEVNSVELVTSNIMTTVTESSLISQAILQSTIIPPTERISSLSVLETSLTLNQPIMSSVEVPSTVFCTSNTSTLFTATNTELSNMVSHQKGCNILIEKTVLPITEDDRASLLDKTIEKKSTSDEIIDSYRSSCHKTLSKSNEVYSENTTNKKNERLSFSTPSVHHPSIDISQRVIMTPEIKAKVRSNHVDLGRETEASNDQIIDSKILNLETCKTSQDSLELSNNVASHITTKENNITKLHPSNNDVYKNLDTYIENSNSIHNLGEKIIHQCEEMGVKEKHLATSFQNNKQNDTSLEYHTNSKIRSLINSLSNAANESEVNHDYNNSILLSQCEYEKAETIPTINNKSDVIHEKNSGFRSNNTVTDEINTSVGNFILNEDETACSSYIPETPENQERDQDQDSAISTSSYEIPPCEELNITSSNIISVSTNCEHSSIHNNGVLEIPTSPYSTNPDSIASCGDEVAESCYENQLITEPSVSTSYQDGISIPNFRETQLGSHSNVSSDSKNTIKTANFYNHTEMTKSYFESISKVTNPTRELKNDLEEKTLQYYEDNSENISSASELYLNEEVNSNFNSHDASDNYYDSQSEIILDQSYYSTSGNKLHCHSVLQNHKEAQHFCQKMENNEQKSEKISYANKCALDSVSDSSKLDEAVQINDTRSANKKSMI
ncbi:uncharacterized protein LOC106637707 [Copidosoma floridanum]|uniref:uncharacterized protein LOC106637707 n=1 Tax=Copidosoma floridanum TaxID=29053 RepID=UPI0006C9DFE5|nr:uncharacterized protein LOC106637707 [Copidosoma floridanum]XP_014206081.1 uncharacterized protein LOC106637707 [Copidosoma floridanum]XP_014206082.1 uncharacterized protein LOC106637707 [Copidosoma floridanum]